MRILLTGPTGFIGSVFARLALKRHAGGINLGTGMGLAVRAIAEHFGRYMDRLDLVEVVSQPEANPLSFMVADASKLRGHGWYPAWNLEPGFEQLVTAHAGSGACKR